MYGECSQCKKKSLVSEWNDMTENYLNTSDYYKLGQNNDSGTYHYCPKCTKQEFEEDIKITNG